jgi:hypothetical protein
MRINPIHLFDQGASPIKKKAFHVVRLIQKSPKMRSLTTIVLCHVI